MKTLAFFFFTCLAHAQYPWDATTQQWLQTNSLGGVTAGYYAGSATPDSDAVRLGFFAGAGPLAELISGVAIARHAGYNAKGSQGVFIGHAAGQYAGLGGSAESSVSIGYLATRNANQHMPHHSFFSVVLGCEAATVAKSVAASTLIGARAGRVANSAAQSVLVGYGAAQASLNAENAVMLGANAGGNAESIINSIYIGQGAGYAYSRNNTLIVESNVAFTGADSLIYGEFDTRTLRLNAANLGFFGKAAIPRPTVTGSRSNNEALYSLLQALHNLGLINDQTTP